MTNATMKQRSNCPDLIFARICMLRNGSSLKNCNDFPILEAANRPCHHPASKMFAKYCSDFAILQATFVASKIAKSLQYFANIWKPNGDKIDLWRPKLQNHCRIRAHSQALARTIRGSSCLVHVSICHRAVIMHMSKQISTLTHFRRNCYKQSNLNQELST